ncbi:hypothetical protein [Azospirillum picis]|uniref:Uncharacterized protein n=1 Tax=Azospirillum picis TaxID=488438 RepID=A0ABU0MUG8_9PROT|nr:hypothetical protein [Azospirillum picis]MBP2303320.1 hypothetical protein [Azospirillum picis]MDQ0537140.1 hypothetical protein [Azospirillum picis]
MAKPFNFSAIFGGGNKRVRADGTRRARAEEQQDETVVEEQQDDTTAEDQQDDTTAEDETQDDTTAEDGQQDDTTVEDEPTKETPAEARARARERTRIGTIMTSAAARGRVEAALSMAINTSMSAKAVIQLLGTLPAGASASAGGGNPSGDRGGLASRMAGLGTGAVPPDRGAGNGRAERSTPLTFKEIQANRAARAAGRSGGAAVPGLPRR